ncbi:MAG: hypothetical protein R3190_16455 [Thermoanaerobaculia bacterium]|nr:hypothetical protein [Thermoanaerobaculia bacterium]
MGDPTAELDGSPEEVLRAVGEAVDLWGGEWRRLGTGGRITLPITAGVRHGFLAGELSTRARSDKVEVTIQPETTFYRLHWPSIVVLALGAAGGLFIVVVPFFPSLFPLVPAGMLLSVAAWFLVVSRLHTRGAPEFLELVADLLKAPPVEEGAASS